MVCEGGGEGAVSPAVGDRGVQPLRWWCWSIGEGERSLMGDGYGEWRPPAFLAMKHLGMVAARVTAPAAGRYPTTSRGAGRHGRRHTHTHNRHTHGRPSSPQHTVAPPSHPLLLIPSGGRQLSPEMDSPTPPNACPTSLILLDSASP